MQKTIYIIRVYRLLSIITHTLYGILIATFIIPNVNDTKRERVVHDWTKGLLRIFNIQIIIKGTPPNWETKGVMFVANHISWIDIHALNSIRTVRFIAKSEIRHWPIFGWFAAKANTLFIERGKKQDAGRIVNTTTESLMNGDCMCYFPEGTTTDGTELKVFKGSLMQSPIDAKANIWPFVIRYPKPDGSANIDMAFAGETTLLESIWSIVCIKNPIVELEFLSIIPSAGYDRRSLTIFIRKQIEDKLNLSAIS